MESLTAEEVRHRMQALRGDLRHDMQQVAADVRGVSDWKYYVRRFPWGSVAAAVAAGYLVVPRKLQVLSPDAQTLATLAKRDQLVVKRQARAEKSHGIGAMLTSLIATSLARAAMAYVGQKFGAAAETATSNPPMAAGFKRTAPK